MKFRLRKLFVLTVVTSCVFLTSCDQVDSINVTKEKADSINVTKEKADIYLQVVNNKATFETKGNMKCKPRNRVKPGCLVFEVDQEGEIKFQKRGSGDWWFTTLQICKLKSDGSEDCNLNVAQRMEFAATDSSDGQLLIPDATGMVDLTLLSASLNEFILYDQNLFIQDYYYRIELCSSPSNCEWADPPLENKGRR
jgi:hypothetical protein